jgi:hypothetical protein
MLLAVPPRIDAHVDEALARELNEGLAEYTAIVASTASLAASSGCARLPRTACAAHRPLFRARHLPSLAARNPWTLETVERLTTGPEADPLSSARERLPGAADDRRPASLSSRCRSPVATPSHRPV